MAPKIFEKLHSVLERSLHEDLFVIDLCSFVFLCEVNFIAIYIMG